MLLQSHLQLGLLYQYLEREEGDEWQGGERYLYLDVAVDMYDRCFQLHFNVR